MLIDVCFQLFLLIYFLTVVHSPGLQINLAIRLNFRALFRRFPWHRSTWKDDAITCESERKRFSSVLQPSSIRGLA